MVIKIFFTFFFGCTFTVANAKVHLLEIKSILDSANVIQMVTIFKYTDSLMYYGYVDSNDTLTLDCNVRRITESFRLDRIKTGGMKETNLAGKWPEVGETRLMVINANNKVELFAILKNGQYRFWDPNLMPFVNSTFLIRKEIPFAQLEDCESNLNTTVGDDWSYWICADGCYVYKYYIDKKRTK